MTQMPPPHKMKAVGLQGIRPCGRPTDPGTVNGRRETWIHILSSGPCSPGVVQNNPRKSQARPSTAAGFQAPGAKCIRRCCVLWAGAEAARKPGEPSGPLGLQMVADLGGGTEGAQGPVPTLGCPVQADHSLLGTVALVGSPRAQPAV